MPAVFRNIVVHLVWSTRERIPFITPEIERRLHRMIEAKSREMGCQVIVINGMPDHVHLLVQMSHDLSVSEFMQKVKGASSGFARKVLLADGVFSWQHGYGAFSVSPESIPSVVAYINNQKNHHAGETDINQIFERSETARSAP